MRGNGTSPTHLSADPCAVSTARAGREECAAQMRASPHDRDDAQPPRAAQRSPRNGAGRGVLGERERGMLRSVMMERACSVACARRQGRERTRCGHLAAGATTTSKPTI
eukprot:scaffold19032_cov118-Isochrysis_galbana.AAC.1